jgi:hypothetical protein
MPLRIPASVAMDGFLQESAVFSMWYCWMEFLMVEFYD